MYKKIIKPLIDFVLAFIATIILFVPMLLIAVIIYIDDPGPVLFKQRRVGKKVNGKITYFNLYKFRSMKMSAPHEAPAHLLENPEQYITRVGSFCRKKGIDELIQIPFCILTGKMSIIGPRPALWNQYDLIEEREKYLANDIKPGLTGWAQINGRNELENPVKAKLDGEYAAALEKGFFSGIKMDCICFFGTFTFLFKLKGMARGGRKSLRRRKK